MASADAEGSAPSLRHFSFFTLSSVKDVLEPSKTPEVFQQTANISTTVCGQSSILVADLDGFLHVIAAPDFSATLSWPAQPKGRVTHAAFSAVRGVTLSVAEDDDSPWPVLNIWSIAASGRRGGRHASPRLLVSGRLQPSSSTSHAHPVTTLAHTSTFSHVAVGFADGSVLLLRHLDQTTQSALATASASALPLPLPKARVLHSANNEPVTGLHFLFPAAKLVVISPSKMVSYAHNGRDAPTTIAEEGSALACSVVTPSGKLIIAKDEALFVFGQDGSREATWAYEGPKLAIYLANNYLVVVSPTFAPTASSASATVRQFVARNRDRTASAEIARVSLFDIDHKFIAHSSAFEDGVRDIFVQWGKIWVLSHDGKSATAAHQDGGAEHFRQAGDPFLKSQYLLALGLASTTNCDDAQKAEIHRRYADHLYAKGDFDGAMSQFLDTIGFTEPSHVIRKFLDAQRIHGLTSYLEALHKHGLANSAHTSLLLNCYTKLKDTARLDAFLKESAGAGGDTSKPPFDLDTALRATRQAGYFDHAVALAKRYGADEDYIRLQIEDRQDYAEALNHVRGLSTQQAEREMQRYGKTLLQHEPEATTQLLIDLCCGSLKPLSRGVPTQTEASTPKLNGSSPRSSSIPIARSRAADAPSAPASNRRSGIYHHISLPVNDAPQETLPSPQLFMAHFATQEKEYIRFLQEVLQRRYSQEIVQDEESQVQAKAMHRGLLELYLSQAAADSSRTTELQAKALELLQTGSVDVNQALLLCITAKFDAGIDLLYEQLDRLQDLFRYRLRSSSSTAALQMLWRYVDKQPSLLVMALRWLTSDASLLSQHTADAERILKEIEQRQLMKPVEVVRLLSRNSHASVGLAKPYLKACFQADSAESASNQGLIQSYRQEIDTKGRDFAALMDPEKPQVFQVSRCSSCGGNLDNPSVHFLCKHSFHQRCISDTDSVDCPLCARDHGLIVEIQRANEAYAGRHDLFLTELQESDEPLQTIATLLGRGLLNSKG